MSDTLPLSTVYAHAPATMAGNPMQELLRRHLGMQGLDFDDEAPGPGEDAWTDRPAAAHSETTPAPVVLRPVERRWSFVGDEKRN